MCNSRIVECPSFWYLTQLKKLHEAKWNVRGETQMIFSTKQQKNIHKFFE